MRLRASEQFFLLAAVITCVLGMLFFYLSFTYARQQPLCDQDVIVNEEPISKIPISKKKRGGIGFPISKTNNPTTMINGEKIQQPDPGRHILFVTHNNDISKIKRYLPVKSMRVEPFLQLYKEHAKKIGITEDMCGLKSLEEVKGRETAVETLDYSDISVMIYVGKNSYMRSLYWRIMTQDTFPDALIISSAYSPIQEIALTYLPGIGETYESNTPKHLLGLAAQYYAHPGRKWYYAGGDDTFIRGEMFKRTLEKFNSSLPLWVGTLGYTSDWTPYVSGGAGVALSRALVEQLIGYVPLSLSVSSSRWSDVFIGKFLWEYSDLPPTCVYNWYAHAPETVAGLQNPCGYSPIAAGTYHYIKSPQQHAGVLRSYLQDLKTIGKLPESYDIEAKIQQIQQKFDAISAKYKDVK